MSTPPFYDAKYYRSSPTWNTWVKCTSAFVHSLRTEYGFNGQPLRHFHLNHPIRFICLTGVITAIDDISPRYTILTLDDSSGSSIEVKITRITRTPGSSADAAENEDTTTTTTTTTTITSTDEIRPPRKANPHHVAAPPPPPLPQAGGGGGVVGPATPQPTPLTTVTNLHIYSTRALGSFLRILLGSDELRVGSVVKAKGTIAEFRAAKQLDLKRIFLVRSTNEEVAAWRAVAVHAKLLAGPWVLSEGERARVEEVMEEEARQEEVEERLRREREARREHKSRKRKEKLKMYEEKQNQRLRRLAAVYDAGAIDRRK